MIYKLLVELENCSDHCTLVSDHFSRVNRIQKAVGVSRVWLLDDFGFFEENFGTANETLPVLDLKSPFQSRKRAYLLHFASASNWIVRRFESWRVAL